MRTVTGRVELIEIVGKSYAGPALWEADRWLARWAVVIQIDAHEGDLPDFVRVHSNMALAVHSPTHVFGHICSSDEAVGRTFRFVLTPNGSKWTIKAHAFP